MTSNPNVHIFDYLAQPKERVRGCPACKSVNRTWIAYGFDRYGYSVSLATCGECSLQYLGDQMTRKGYNTFYAGAYRRLVWQKDNPGVPFDQKASDVRVKDSQQLYAMHLKNFFDLAKLPKVTGAVLDAGGSTGLVAKALGYTNVVVLDPAKQELPATGVTGYLEDEIPYGPYDLILCCETLDHLTDPKAALANMRKVLGRNGRLFVDIISPKTWKLYHSAIKIDHPLYWTEKALTNALEAAGFTIELMVDRNYTQRIIKTWAVCK
jgi:2-polyprenyl-3-methyl-5-hydroxy-6-metoxy-1,4-benzoquinol methylase